MISIDTKKKEILGNFFHPGRAATPTACVHVQDHDFVTSQQRLVPYGVFDTRRNEGLLLLSRGSDTSQLACDAIWRWWQRLGKTALRACSAFAVALRLRRQQRQPSTSVQGGLV